MTDAGLSHPWLEQAEDRVREDPATVTQLFALAGRKVGRGPLAPASDPQGVVHGGIEDAARARLVVALVHTSGAQAATALEQLFQQGDSAERRGVLRGLDAAQRAQADLPSEVVERGLVFVNEALRANEADLVAAAMGPFAEHHLDQHSWRHGVLKLVFLGVSLDAVAGLDDRADDELARMARDFATERRAAGRDIPADISRLTSERSA